VKLPIISMTRMKLVNGDCTTAVKNVAMPTIAIATGSGA
jgi:hypothetical protein